MNAWPRSHFCAQGSTPHRMCLSLDVRKWQKRPSNLAGGDALESFCPHPDSSNCSNTSSSISVTWQQLTCWKTQRNVKLMSDFVVPRSDSDDDEDDDSNHDASSDRRKEASLLIASFLSLLPLCLCLIAPPLFFLGKLLMRISCYVDVRGTVTCCLPAQSLWVMGVTNASWQLPLSSLPAICPMPPLWVHWGTLSRSQ